jgi:hypothetical protein
MEAVEVFPRFIEETADDHTPPQTQQAAPITTQSSVMVFFSQYKVHIIVFLIVILIIVLAYLVFFSDSAPATPTRLPDLPQQRPVQPKPKEDYEATLRDIQKANAEKNEVVIDMPEEECTDEHCEKPVREPVSEPVRELVREPVREPEQVERYKEEPTEDDSTVVEMNLVDTFVEDSKQKKRCAARLANGQQCKKMTLNTVCNIHQNA